MGQLVTDVEVLGILQGFNPWWVGRELPSPAFRRLAFDVCRRHLADATLHRAILLSGPRRVGKTTILNQIAESLCREGVDPKSVLYVSLDHPILKLLTLPNLLRIYHANIYPEGKPATLLLDEIQYSKGWDLELKQLIDHQRAYRILATGSASAVHGQRLMESGVGRWIRVPIPTLSFYEFLQIRNEMPRGIPGDLRPVDLFTATPQAMAELAFSCRPLMPGFRDYLLVGGFPETALQHNIALSQRLLREDVVERVIKRDMTALFGIRNVNDLERLFIYLCLHSGGIFAVNSCAGDLGVSATTVANYLDILEQANLIFRVAPTNLGGKKILKARYKIYLVDAALRNAVLLRGEEILSHPEEMGTIVETTVLRHLYAYYYRDTPQIAYWRDARTLREVDIIIKSPSYLIPVEIKYRSDANLTAGEGIVLYSKDEKADYAYWVTKDERDFDLRHFADVTTPFLRVPAHIFVFLLGQAERLLWTA